MRRLALHDLKEPLVSQQLQALVACMLKGRVRFFTKEEGKVQNFGGFVHYRAITDETTAAIDREAFTNFEDPDDVLRQYVPVIHLCTIIWDYVIDSERHNARLAQRRSQIPPPGKALVLDIVPAISVVTSQKQDAARAFFFESINFSSHLWPRCINSELLGYM